MKGKHQNQLTEDHIAKIIDTYKHRTEAPRYTSTAMGEEEISMEATNQTLVDIEKDIQKALNTHNEFLKQHGQPLL